MDDMRVQNMLFVTCIFFLDGFHLKKKQSKLSWPVRFCFGKLHQSFNSFIELTIIIFNGSFHSREVS